MLLCLTTEESWILHSVPFKLYLSRDQCRTKVRKIISWIDKYIPTRGNHFTKPILINDIIDYFKGYGD